ncbi:MAG: CotH kinase family protein [Saprospiraceae bacterium]|nr:CotH kinase family protein [Saprospiraceae bacterium]
MSRYWSATLVLICIPFLFLLGQKNKEVEDIYQLDNILEVKIYFQEANWDQILDSLKQEGKDGRLVGKVIVNGKTYEQAGIRYKGNSSYYSVRKSGRSKLPFNIKVDHIKKDQEFPGGYGTLKLSNVFRDPSFLREVLSYEIAREYMFAPRANFAKVYVNDTYLGLYNNTESVDKMFLRNSFGEDKGVFFKCDPNWHADRPSFCKEGDKSSLMYLGEDTLCYQSYYEIKSAYGFGELVDLTAILNKRIDLMETVLDVDQTLWMLAFNNVLVNLDSYNGKFCHNYYLYQDKEGVFHPILWDMNLSFGGFRYDGLGSPLSNEKMQRMSPFMHYKTKNPKRPLITKLLAEDLYRKVYVAHIRTILNDFFVDSTYLKKAEAIQTIISPLVEADTNKLYKLDAFQQNATKSAKADKSSIIGLEELMGPRTNYLINHPLIKTPAPIISEVKAIDFGDLIAVNATFDGAQRAWLMYRQSKKGTFKRVEMFDDGGNSDGVGGDGIWGATVDMEKKKKNFQYYIIAEGAKAAALSPEKASSEFHTLKR